MSIDHQDKVANYVVKMLEDDSFHDVTIVCDNGEVKANKGILCASSKYAHKIILFALTSPLSQTIVTS